MHAETYALLWSKKANCFHVEPITETVKKGREFFLANLANDYLLVDVGTHETVTSTAESLRHVVHNREAVRGSYVMEC